MLIGITGWKRSGKDTVGEMLRKRDFASTSFAHKLKEIVCDTFDYDMSIFETEAKDVIDERYGKTPRGILIDVGTGCFRSIYQDVWVDYVFREEVTAPNWCITDVRFQNEADKVIEAGGIILRVSRPGYEKGEDVGDIDFARTPHVEIENDHTLLALRIKVDSVIRGFRETLEDLEAE